MILGHIRPIKGYTREAVKSADPLPEPLWERSAPLVEALTGGGYADHVLELPLGQTYLAVLDVDHHGERSAGVTPQTLRAMAGSLDPAPSAWWVSHSGTGLHALYRCANDRVPPLALAAMAGLGLLRRYPVCTIDLLTRSVRIPTRDVHHVGHGRTVASLVPPLPYWLASSTESAGSHEAWEEWLAARGLEVGKRYPHDRCPVAPYSRSHADPVVVYSDGIYCHRCERRISADSVTRSRAASEVVVSAECLVSPSGVRPSLRELAKGRIVHAPSNWPDAVYALVLRAVHAAPRHGQTEETGEWPGIAACLASGSSDTDPEIVLTAYGFVDLKTAKPYKFSVRTASSLAYARRWKWDDDKKSWEGRSKAATVDLLVAGTPSVGWPVVDIGPPFRWWGVYRDYSGAPAVRVPGPWGHPQRPQYVQPDSRMPLERAEGILLDYAPRLDLDHLRLLLVAMAYGEGGHGRVPIVVSTGHSGMGKTVVAKIAAALYGTSWVDPPAGNTRDPLTAFIVGRALTGARLVAIDEVVKQESTRKWFETEMLQLSRDATGHVLYKGAVQAPLNLCVYCTDNELPTSPKDWLTDPQILRRVSFYAPQRTMGYPAEEVLKASLWWRDSERAAAACAILSDLVDTYLYPTPPAPAGRAAIVPEFAEVAAQLGAVNHLSEAGQPSPQSSEVEEFVRRLARAPVIDGVRRGYRPASGWVEVSRDGPDARLSELWEELRDHEDPGLSRVISSTDLASLVGVQCRVEVKDLGALGTLARLTNGVSHRSASFLVGEKVLDGA